MLHYVTTNPGKAHEVAAYLDDEVTHLDYDYTEIQAGDFGPIAADGARRAVRHAGEPVVVDDAGLTIDGLDGFPGPYSSYVEETVGVEAVYRLCERETEPPRDASFRCVLAYCDGTAVDEPATAPDGSGAPKTDADDSAPVRLFEGAVEGRIVEPRGTGGFGYDPIFEHEGRTLAERSADEKNEVSHRGRALEAFADWYAGRKE